MSPRSRRIPIRTCGQNTKVPRGENERPRAPIRRPRRHRPKHRKPHHRLCHTNRLRCPPEVQDGKQVPMDIYVNEATGLGSQSHVIRTGRNPSRYLGQRPRQEGQTQETKPGMIKRGLAAEQALLALGARVLMTAGATRLRPRALLKATRQRTRPMRNPGNIARILVPKTALVVPPHQRQLRLQRSRRKWPRELDQLRVQRSPAALFDMIDTSVSPSVLVTNLLGSAWI